MSDRRRSVILLVGAVVLWSTSGLFIKLSSLNPLALAGGRSAITALVLLAWIGKPRFTWSSSQIGGALSMVLTFGLFVTATQLTSAANAILLQFTAPLYVALFGGWFLGERPKSYDWWTMAAIVAGMVLFFGDALGNGGMLGNILAMCSGVTLAWMTLFLRKQREESATTILLGNMLTAAIGLPFLLLSPPQPVDWAILLFLGVFQLGIPFIMYSLSLRHLEALEAILIQTLEPILNPIWVFLVLGERPSPLALLGGALVILAVALRAFVATRQVTGDG